MFAKTLWFAVALPFLSSVLCSSGEEWWQHGVFYQVYPRSFRDVNNDGNGDLAGVIEKLDHFKDAGVDGVWLSPIMQSPQIDAGYDISDYYKIEDMYGHIDDLKELIKKAHEIGIKIILDFVPNHTSNLHKWFQESENGNEEYKDYYVWADAKEDGSPPNNWISVFRGSAWQWSDKRKQYYLHHFVKEQPDLNYRNPKVREDMKKILVYYMDIGVDGFRVDAIPYLVEDKELRDEPRSYNPNVSEEDNDYLKHIYTNNQPETYEVIYDWRKLVDDYTANHGGDARILMTEAYADLEHTMPYYGTPDGSQKGSHFTFNFFFITNFNKNISTAHDISRIVYMWKNALPSIYTSNWVLGNHDNRRIPTRLGVENIDGFNMLVQLLPGIAVTYNGEEFGQEDGEVTYEQGKDPSARNRSIFEATSRDFERTPFQWDDTINAGFNEGAEPWLPVSEKYKKTNLASQLDEKVLSHYQIYKALTRKRKEDPTRIGSTDIWAISDDVIVLKRSHGNKHTVLAFKLGWHDKNEEETVYVPSVGAKGATVALTNVGSSYKIGSVINPQNFKLKPHESLVLDIVD
ncbi:maltase 1-like [Harmonia axyridis]|uniref:maltase 1-like n=1 Tax=Harmonia axyridis TaxID=115357 RepID=UPI001E274DFA|nr:maltase 1-like [Harmonia axyridis]